VQANYEQKLNESALLAWCRRTSGPGGDKASPAAAGLRLFNMRNDTRATRSPRMFLSTIGRAHRHNLVLLLHLVVLAIALISRPRPDHDRTS